MDNQSLVKGLTDVAKMLLDIANQVAPSEKTEEPKKTKVEKSPEEMTFTELKKYAKSQGVDTAGTRDEILERLNPTEEVEEDDEDVEEDIGIVDDEAEADLKSQVEAMSQEDLADILTEAGLSAKGKHATLVTRVLKAIDDGDIELYDEDEEEEVEESPVTKKKAPSKKSSEPADDGTYAEVTDFSSMTKERAQSVADFRLECIRDFASGDFPREDVVQWLQDYNDDTDDRTNLTDKQLFTDFLIQGAKYIGDDGEIYAEQLETLYEVGGEYYCCGKELDYDEEEESFVCSVCETVYEAE